MTSKEAAELSKRYLAQKEILSGRARDIIKLIEDFTIEEKEDILSESLYVSFWEVYQGVLRVIIRGSNYQSEIEEDLSELPVEWLLASDEEFSELTRSKERREEIANTKNKIKELQEKLKKLEK